VAEYFTGMFRRKAFLHWYTGHRKTESSSHEARVPGAARFALCSSWSLAA